MIKALLKHEDDRYIVSISGHANYAESGKDIVCAGVSTLAQAFAFYVADLKEEYIKLFETNEKHGEFIFICEGPKEEIYPAFGVLKAGLEAISENFSENVYLSGGKSK